MREISSPQLNDLSNLLASKIDCGSYLLSGRAECYNVRRHDAQLKKKMEYKFEPVPREKMGLMSSSPQNWSPLSPFGLLTNDKCRESYCELIEVLNASYTDYSFENVRPHEFEKENVQDVINRVNQKLQDGFSQSDRMTMWNLISSQLGAIQSVYSYKPANVSDENEEGKLWQDTFFFVNQEEKKILLFNLYAQEKRSVDDAYDSDDSDYDNCNMKNVSYYVQSHVLAQSNLKWQMQQMDDGLDMGNQMMDDDEDDFQEDW